MMDPEARVVAAWKEAAADLGIRFISPFVAPSVAGLKHEYLGLVIKTFDVPGVAGGTNQGLDSFTLVQATTNVPARIGTRFGFRYTIHGTPTNSPVILTMIGEHPPL